mgnify:CR=1 FL=1
MLGTIKNGCNKVKNVIEDCEKHCMDTKITQPDYSCTSISEVLGIIIGEKYTKLPRD